MTRFIGKRENGTCHLWVEKGGKRAPALVMANVDGRLVGRVDWGSVSDGAAVLAFVLTLQATDQDEEAATYWYPLYLRDVVSKIDADAWSISVESVRDWMIEYLSNEIAEGRFYEGYGEPY